MTDGRERRQESEGGISDLDFLAIVIAISSNRHVRLEDGLRDVFVRDVTEGCHPEFFDCVCALLETGDAN